MEEGVLSVRRLKAGWPAHLFFGGGGFVIFSFSYYTVIYTLNKLGTVNKNSGIDVLPMRIRNYELGEGHMFINIIT